ncbi:hypothetical protein [Streptomyces canus]|uniref:hypothetical protein n=1 Tax=Streptomyces canus TaxID=58343 RepID=UPI00380080F0
MEPLTGPLIGGAVGQGEEGALQGVRERITGCTDLDRMDTWPERSRTVERAEDLFDEEGNADEPIS